MRRDNLKNADPAGLTDEELDIAVGALQEEIDSMDDEVAQAQNLIAQLQARRVDSVSRLNSARAEQGVRGRGRGNT